MAATGSEQSPGCTSDSATTIGFDCRGGRGRGESLSKEEEPGGQSKELKGRDGDGGRDGSAMRARRGMVRE